MLPFIDNYDSFTYDIVQYFAEFDQNIEIRRSDGIVLKAIVTLKPRYLVIGLGPRTSKEASIFIAAIRHSVGKLPVMGVCLGHQAIGGTFGGDIIHTQTLIHGKVPPVFHHGEGMFKNLPDPVTCTRYHSFVIDHAALPECLEVTSWTEDNEIMSVRHKNYAVEGVQFHPETLLTEYGHGMLRNFLGGFKDLKVA